ncbi:MAG: acyltransferase family protein [Bacteroidota bacterium]
MGKTHNDRLMLPDVLKGVAVLLMIQVHLMELFARQDIYDSLAGKISLFLGGPPAAPVFMAVMGYFIAKQGADALKNILRGIRLIVYGFLLNIGLNLHLLYHIFTGELALNPLTYIFGVDILFLAGLSLIIISLLRLLLRDSLVPWLAVLLVVALSATFIPAGMAQNQWSDYVLAYIYLDVPWSYFPLQPWLAYPLAGYCFFLFSGKYLKNLTERQLLMATLTGLIPFIVFFPYGFSITVNLPAYYHHDFFYFLWAMLFLGTSAMLFRQVIRWFPSGPVTGFLRWTGRNVTAFYVFQWLLIGNLATAFYKSAGGWALVLWFFGITMITGLLVRAYRAGIKFYRFRVNDDVLK